MVIRRPIWALDALIGGILLGLLASGASAEEPLPNPEFPLIVAFGNSESIRVRSIEDRGPMIVYMELSGALVSAPKVTVDMATTTIVNKALAAFTVACEKNLYVAALFEMSDRATKVFDTAANRENRSCWRHLQEQHAAQRLEDKVLSTPIEAPGIYPTPTAEELAAAQAEHQRLKDHQRELEEMRKRLRERPPPELLDLLSWHWHRDRSFAKVEGEVRNIAGETLENVVVVVTFYTADGTLITSDHSLLEYSVLLEDQTSPFQVLVDANPKMWRATIEFRTFGGVPIPWKGAATEATEHR